MIYKVTIPFTSDEGIKYTPIASSLMHGLLMETIDIRYADQLHTQGLHPYSQFVDNIDGHNVWTLNLLDDESYERIALPITSLTSAHIRYKNDVIFFGKAAVTRLSYEELFFSNRTNNHSSDMLKMEFLTPTAFKSSGRYSILPTLRQIILSISKRFDSAFGIEFNDYTELEEAVLRELTVSHFKLESTSFSVDGARIPSFKGSIEFRIKGEDNFRSYICMLGDFAQYSGVGIKTALGMGRVRTQKK